MWKSNPVRYILLAAALAASGLTAFAQLQDQNPPRIVTGPDLGFRIEGTDPRTGNPTGTWLVRINGQWREIASVPGPRPATMR